MPIIQLRYRFLFLVCIAMVLLFICGWYLMAADWDGFFRRAGLPAWIVVTASAFATIYSLITLVITSYEIKLDGLTLEIKRPWGAAKTYRVAEIARTSKVRHHVTLVWMKDGAVIPIVGLTPVGIASKAKFEAYLTNPELANT